MNYQETSSVKNAFETLTGEEPPKGKLGKIAKRMRAPTPAFHDDPVRELRRLVQQRKNQTRAAVRLEAMQADRKRLKEGPNGEEKGSKILCTLPDDLRSDLLATSGRIKALNAGLDSQIETQLKQLPIYEHFFSKVYGCGTVTAAYYTAMIRIDISVKSSQLRRYCGYATDATGRIERRTGGPKKTGGTGTYNDDLRTMGYLLFSAMRKNAARFTTCSAHAATKPEKPKKKDPEGHKIWREATLACDDCRRTDVPYGHTTKYLTRAADAKRGALSVGMPRFKADSKGFHKAIDLFLEDMYLVWRSLEGLPVWPEYHAMKLGFVHGGKVCINEPRLITLEKALETVGYLGKTKVTFFQGDVAAEDEEDESVD
jgi:hypothetical protein